MEEIIARRGNVVDIVDQEGDVVPVDVHELDWYDFDGGADVLRRPGNRLAEYTIGRFFCGDCGRETWPKGCGHVHVPAYLRKWYEKKRTKITPS
ncbi:MAG: hypothetical protein Q4A34_01195 [Candidatus Saccharibacteria bacterium]|nr:hypothetical protein [Candidatus Saccharibacteria bacterium]